MAVTFEGILGDVQNLLLNFLQCVRKSLLFLISMGPSFKFRSLCTGGQQNNLFDNSRSMTVLVLGSIEEEGLPYLLLKDLPLD